MPSLSSSPGPALVHIEYRSWLCRELGLGDVESSIQDVTLRADESVGSLFARLAAEWESFGRLVYDPEEGRIRGYVAVLLNGRLVDLAGGAEAKLAGDDHLILLPGFSGGCDLGGGRAGEEGLGQAIDRR